MKQEGFEIPDSILTKIYDLTGTPEGGNRGYVIMYINEHGKPVIRSRFDHFCTQIALTKTAEHWLDQMEEQIS
jgi:hypothetical protein